MAVPTYDRCMLPLLQFSRDNREHHIRETVEALTDYFELSEEDRAERLPSGTKTRIYDRVAWAKTYLAKAGLLESTGRGTFRITARGVEVLAANPPDIDIDLLMEFPEFVEFRAPHQTETTSLEIRFEETHTPQELLETSYRSLREQLAEELLANIMSCPPDFFERLVVDLLLAMGYGGDREDAGQVLGRTGDGGVDGLIKEDKLGFDVIYIQAKRWSAGQSVGRGDVQGFAGSMMGRGVTKGVFITTSRFSEQARQYAGDLRQVKITLIDGEQLADLMIDHDVGVRPVETYIIKKVDSNYFELE